MTASRQQRLLLDGPSGKIEVYLDHLAAEQSARGSAIIAHPHPLFGGTAENKVVTTVARALRELGYVTLRPNFRGVGASQGSHDNGVAETADLLAVHAYARESYPGLPIVLAGYSFGAYVISCVAQELVRQGEAAERLVLIGTATGLVSGGRSYDAEPVPPDTLVIHGDKDETVPLANVLAWAEKQELPVVVVPGADHFYHRKLHLLRSIVHSAWRN